MARGTTPLRRSTRSKYPAFLIASSTIRNCRNPSKINRYLFLIASVSLLSRFVELTHPVPLLQDFAWLRSIRWPHDAILLHKVDQPRRAPVPDAQPSLQGRGRRAPHLTDHPDGILIELIIDFLAALFAAFAPTGSGVLILRRPEQLFVVYSLRLLPPELAHRLHFLLAHIGTMDTVQSRRPRRQVEHIPLAE